MSLLLAHLRTGGIPWQGSAAIGADDGRPLLLLVGTALDHWSSRLAAELAAEAGLASALAEVFRCVALDAAAEPAIAARVQRVLQLTAGATGWPAVAVGLPDGRLFGALAWRPLSELAHLLLQAATAWHERPADCRSDAAHLAAAEAQLVAPAVGRPLTPELMLDGAESAANEAADTLAGGFGPPPRTAEPALWSFLIARAGRAEAPLALGRQVERSLAAWCAGAAHDHFGGGFFRGCADAGWREPFGEKRLADQAHAALLLLDAADRLGGTGAELWRGLAERTLGFAIAALRRPDGAYAHGFHADSPTAPGRWEDGAVARWTEAQVAEVVGAEGARLVARRFGLGSEPAVPAAGEALPTAEARRLPELVQRLAVARGERPQPRRDDTAYPAEQGLIAVALERAGLGEHLPPLAGTDPWTGRALAARWRRTGVAEPRALAIAGEDLLDALDPLGDLAPAAVLGHLRLDLYAITGETRWRESAFFLVDRARDRLRAAPLAHAGLLSVLDRLSGPTGTPGSGR